LICDSVLLLLLSGTVSSSTVSKTWLKDTADHKPHKQAIR
jgi:hypothetical protein